MNITDEDDKRDPVCDVVDQFAERLMEHVDSCRIFITKRNQADDSTTTYVKGRGDYYSTRGFIEQWLNQERAKERREAELEVDNDDSD